MSLLTDVTESMRNSLFEGIVADTLDEELEAEKALEASCGKATECDDVELTDEELAELLEEDSEDEDELALESATEAVVCEDDVLDDDFDDIDEEDLGDEPDDDITDALDGIEDSMEFDADDE